MKVKREKNEKLFIEVGAGVLVKKTPDEARKVITEQIRKFSEARVHLTAQLEEFRQQLGMMLERIEEMKNEERKRK